MIYEISLKYLKSKHSRAVKTVTALEVFILGAMAKLGATVSTYPLLVVRVNFRYVFLCHRGSHHLSERVIMLKLKVLFPDI